MVNPDEVDVEQLYKTRQHFVCNAKTDTTTPGKQGRSVGFITWASRAGVGFLDCTVTGLYRILHYCRFLYISSMYIEYLYVSVHDCVTVLLSLKSKFFY